MVQIKIRDELPGVGYLEVWNPKTKERGVVPFDATADMGMVYDHVQDYLDHTTDGWEIKGHFHMRGGKDDSRNNG